MTEQEITNSIVKMVICSQIMKESMETIPNSKYDEFSQYSKFFDKGFASLMKACDKKFKTVIHKINEELFDADAEEYQNVISAIEQIIDKRSEQTIMELKLLLR